MAHHTAALLVLSALMLDSAVGLLTKGSTVVPAGEPVFLTKFCFDFDANGRSAGDWRLEITDASPKTGDLELVIFDDEAFSYPDESARMQFQCGSERLKQAAKVHFPINVSALPSGGRFTMPLHEHLRPRWWFVAAIDCSGIERTIGYSLHMTNPLQGWQKEFSMDHCGMVSMILALGAYATLAFAQQHVIMQQSESARHPLRLILFAAIAAACWGSLALVLDGFWFAHHGKNQTALYLLAKFFKVFSKSQTACMLLLLSQGICISRPLNTEFLYQISKCLVPFFGACLMLEVWGESSQSRAYTTGFIYCTWFGGVLLLADLGFLAVYLMNLHKSYLAELDAEKQHFYCYWGLLYSCAFIVLPFATLLASVLSPWVRVETIFLVTNSVHAAMLGSLVVGLWPEREQKMFCLDDDKLAKTIGTKTDTYANLLECSPSHKSKAAFANNPTEEHVHFALSPENLL
jgi:hypothetical protein